MRAAVIVALMSAGIGSAEAQTTFLSGNRLYELCTSRSSDDRATCRGYAIGLADAASEPYGVNGHRACIPRGATWGQLEDTVARYLREIPQFRHAPAAELLGIYLASQFPCR